MCLHANFGGSCPELQKAVLRGYHSIKPLKNSDIFDMQVLFILFILSVMAECIESRHNAWLENVLEWMGNEVLPGLVSGAGYMAPSVYGYIP
jgi:hypothetical protein